MLCMSIRYVRYALMTLSGVGFGASFN